MEKNTLEPTFLEEGERTAFRQKRGGLLLLTFLFGLGLAAGCAPVFFKSHLVGLLQLSAFLVLGVLYALLVQTLFSATQGGEAFSGAVFFALALFIAVGLFSYLAGALQALQLLYFFSAFLLPVAVAEAARLYTVLAITPKAVWQYAAVIPEEAPFVYLENKPLRMRVSAADKTEEYTSLAPLSLPLGLAFFYAIKDARSRAEWLPYFLNDEGRPYAWVFYNRRFGFWKSYFNPEETLAENRIKAKTVIVAERL